METSELDELVERLDRLCHVTPIRPPRTPELRAVNTALQSILVWYPQGSRFHEQMEWDALKTLRPLMDYLGTPSENLAQGIAVLIDKALDETTAANRSDWTRILKNAEEAQIRLVPDATKEGRKGLRTNRQNQANKGFARLLLLAVERQRQKESADSEHLLDVADVGLIEPTNHAAAPSTGIYHATTMDCAQVTGEGAVSFPQREESSLTHGDGPVLDSSNMRTTSERSVSRPCSSGTGSRGSNFIRRSSDGRNIAGAFRRRSSGLGVPILIGLAVFLASVSVVVLVGWMPFLGGGRPKEVHSPAATTKVAASCPKTVRTNPTLFSGTSPNTLPPTLVGLRVQGKKGGGWLPGIAPVSPGSDLRFVLSYFNNSSVAQTAVSVKVTIPPAALILPGDTCVEYSWKAWATFVPSNGIDGEGIDLGTFPPISMAYVVFSVAMPEEGDIGCGETDIRVTGEVWSKETNEHSDEVRASVFKIC